MRPDWFLIANASRARIAQRDSDGRFTIFASLEHPASRLHAAQLGTDKAGREVGGRSFGGAAFEPRIDAQRKEHLLFAHELAQTLERHANDGAFARLDVYASNPFLGMLNHAFGDATRQRLGAAYAVDLSGVGLAELGARIRHEVRAAAEGAP